MARARPDTGHQQDEQARPLQLYCAIEQAVAHQLDALEQRANAIADRFFDEHFSRRQREKQQWGSYGVRVRRRTNCLSIDWYRMVFYGPRGNRRKTHNHLSKGRTYQYPRSKFTAAKDWEIEAIMAAEEQFSRIRKAADRLAELARQAHYYDQTAAYIDEHVSRETS